MAWLMILNFFRPSPPMHFGWQILSQLTKWSFLVPRSCPHQKALVIASNLSQTVSGILRQEKVNKGMAWRTDEIKVVMSAWERSLAFHRWSLFCTLSMMFWKSTTLLPLSLKLMPKYLLGFWTRFTWREDARDSWISRGIFGEQNRSALLKLMLWPEIE